MRKCDIATCENKHFTGGLCAPHYRKKRWAECKEEMSKNQKKWVSENKDRVNASRNKRNKERRDKLRKHLEATGRLRTTGECRECGCSVPSNRRCCDACIPIVRARKWQNYVDKNRDRKKTLEYKFTQRAKQAKARNIPWTLTFEEFVTIINDVCHYCDSSAFGSMGIDRVDSFGIYEEENCVPCCRTCNQIKNQNLDERETMIVAQALKEYRNNRDPEITKTGCVKIPIKMFEDSRGYFTELFSPKVMPYINQTSYPSQINFSSSHNNVIRGMHYNNVNPQSKLVRVISGEVIDCVIDLREGSDTYGKMESFYLNRHNYALYVPKGFAHGFWAREEESMVMYACWGSYDPQNDAGINPLDENFAFPWKKYDLKGYKMSDKDLAWEPYNKETNFVKSHLSEFVYNPDTNDSSGQEGNL